MVVHDQVEGGVVLESIVQGGQPGAGTPRHDVTFCTIECSLEEGKCFLVICPKYGVIATSRSPFEIL